MRLISILFITILLLPSCNRASRSDDVRPTRNVILMIPDGTSTSLLSLAKWYGRYMGEEDFELNLKDHVCGLMSSHPSDGMIPCSAAAMSGIMTGMPQRAGNISVYPLSIPGQDVVEVNPDMAYQPLATVMEAARLDKDMATGLVATVRFYHATPAACVAHIPSRYETDVIASQMASSGLDVLFAGGVAKMDGYLKGLLNENGVDFLENDIEGFRKLDGSKPSWALFGSKNMDFDIDRDTAAVPSLSEMTAKAIEILSKDRNGFFLMVEGSQVDYGAHANDPNATITEFLAFDKAVGVAMDFARKDGNTTVIVVPDHGTAGITAMKDGVRNYVLKGIDSVFVDMKNFKATYHKLGKMLAGCAKEDIRPIFKEWTGIELTDREFELILRTQGKKEEDYMEVAYSENLESAITSILTSHTNITFVSGAHTSEDVFLAAYHPYGDVPQGILTNRELNAYLCSVTGLKRQLQEVTDDYFVSHTTLLAGYDYSVSKDLEIPQLTVSTEAGEVVIPAWTNVVSVAGTSHRLPVASVYIKENGIFYLPRSIVELL